MKKLISLLLMMAAILPLELLAQQQYLKVNISKSSQGSSNEAILSYTSIVTDCPWVGQYGNYGPCAVPYVVNSLKVTLYGTERELQYSPSCSSQILIGPSFSCS